MIEKLTFLDTPIIVLTANSQSSAVANLVQYTKETEAR